MNKQMLNMGRKLSVDNMKKLLGGGPGVGGTGTGLRCGTPPPPGRCDLNFTGECCTCCAGPTGAICRAQAQQNPVCYLV